MTDVCEPCLRRSALIAGLAGHIEILRRRRRYVRDVLALEDDELVAALGAGRRPPPCPDPADLARVIAGSSGLAAFCRNSDGYPPALQDDRSAPAVLYLAGAPDRWRGLSGCAAPMPAVAVVGMRKASADGLAAARALGRALSAAGVTVVSGMAIGIDGAAHEGALAAGAHTIAVLGGPADRPYPRRHAQLHAELRDRGAVVSELPPGSPVFPWAFLARNRIIAGLSAMTVVVEAAGRSGSLATAEMALDLGREVGAVPGSPLSWRTAGTNELLRDGAVLVRGAEDVVERLAEVTLAPAPVPVRESLPGPLADLVADIAGGCDTVSALAARHGGAGPVQAALLDLELRGAIVRLGGGRLAAAGF